MSSLEMDPLVGIIMGSDSDLEIMQHAGKALQKFDVPHEFGIKSAHRTPERMRAYGRNALARGLKVIIAGAGGSAHLQGMTVPETRLPVLGVAIESRPDPTMSSIGSQIRMPEGVPLAFMGINQSGAFNAGLEAVRILALSDDELGLKYDAYVKDLARQVEEKDMNLGNIGARAYMAELRAKAEE